MIGYVIGITREHYGEVFNKIHEPIQCQRQDHHPADESRLLDKSRLGDHNIERGEKKWHDYQDCVRTRRSLLAFSREPFVDYAIEVTLHRDHLRLARRIERPLSVVILATVIGCASARITEHLISAVNVHKPGLGIGRGRNVGMIFARESTIGRLNFVSGRARSESENTVEVRHVLPSKEGALQGCWQSTGSCSDFAFC